MSRRYFQVFVFALAAALLSSSQCYGYCSGSARAASASSQAGNCHKHPHHNGNPTDSCNHQHSEFSSPEQNVDLAKLVSFNHTAHLAPLGTISSRITIVPSSSKLWIQPDRAGPSGTKTFLLLSALRV